MSVKIEVYSVKRKPGVSKRKAWRARHAVNGKILARSAGGAAGGFARMDDLVHSLELLGLDRLPREDVDG